MDSETYGEPPRDGKLRSPGTQASRMDPSSQLHGAAQLAIVRDASSRATIDRRVRLGLRLQILLLLGALMVLAFGPLFYAVVTYTSYAMSELRDANARSLARVVAREVARSDAPHRTDEEIGRINALIAPHRIEALAVHDRSGHLISRWGRLPTLERLPPKSEPGRAMVSEVAGTHGGTLAVAVPEPSGAVLVVLRTEGAPDRTGPLVRLVALYMALMALALLIAAYFALTTLIVQPLVALGRAAERVASGARRLDVPGGGARELAELGSSLHIMTERLLANEDELRSQIAEVERATKQLKEAQERLVRSERLASVGRLAAGLAHEIGNPLSALLGMEDLLLHGDPEPGEARDFLRRMQQETERIHVILRDLLAFSRPTAEQRGQPVEPGLIEVAVEDTVALVSPQRALRHVRLSLEIEPDLPAVPMSREQLVQVLLNLLLNAADACGDGGQIAVRAHRTPAGVRVAVEDDGPGIRESIRPRLFEPFVTTKEVGKGTGLGLAVCRGLVEAAGGSIALDETSRERTRFVIDLPGADVE